MERDNGYLIELLTRNIKELEKVEDDSKTINFVARRIVNIVKHMKDLRDDLRPRGHGNGHAAADQQTDSARRTNTLS